MLGVTQLSVTVPKSKEKMYDIQLKKFNKRAFSTLAFEFYMRNSCRSAIRQDLLSLTQIEKLYHQGLYSVLCCKPQVTKAVYVAI